MQITLSQLAKPRFPHRCVVCGAENPPTTASLTARDPLAGRAIWQLFDGWHSVEVPCCHLCGWRLHTERLGRSLIVLVGALGAVVLTVLFQHEAGERLELFAIAGASTALAVGAVLLARRVTLPFDFEPRGDNVVFTFHDLALGYEFRAMNAPEAGAGGLTRA